MGAGSGDLMAWFFFSRLNPHCSLHSGESLSLQGSETQQGHLLPTLPGHCCLWEQRQGRWGTQHPRAHAVKCRGSLTSGSGICVPPKQGDIYWRLY